jgi:hypothetical protein
LKQEDVDKVALELATAKLEPPQWLGDVISALWEEISGNTYFFSRQASPTWQDGTSQA